MFEVTETTISKVHHAFKSGELTCEELVEAYLNRIEALDRSGPKLKSVISVNPDALDTAKRLDKDFESGGLSGPLHGIPVSLKDNCETADMPTTAGSTLLKGFCTGRDAHIVKQLSEAGAIILAKTNLHEFAIWGETVSSVLGQTLNPYDLTRTPGGSSGGTGAAVAANLGLVGIGTDTVNSIRSPASACCLCGIRPTTGLVSTEGIVPYSHTQDTAGPITRTVEDAVCVLEVITGRTYGNYLKSDGLTGKRLGVLRNFFGNDGGSRPVNEVMKGAMAIIENAGATLVPLEDIIDSDQVASEVSVHLYELKAHLGQYLAAFGDKAPIHSIEDILESGKYTPGIEENLQKANGFSIDSGEYQKRLALRTELIEKINAIFDWDQLDGIIYPHQKQLVCKVNESQRHRNGVLASVIGFPSVTVPGGFSEPSENAPVGVPIGLEILGKPYDEGNLIGIAYGFEQSSMIRREPVLRAVVRE